MYPKFSVGDVIVINSDCEFIVEERMCFEKCIVTELIGTLYTLENYIDTDFGPISLQRDIRLTDGFYHKSLENVFKQL